MNRTIKFRAWDGSAMRHFDFSDVDGGNIGVPSWDSSLYLYSDPVVLMQFTGLKDVHGKEIYEGDIIKTFSLTGGEFYGKVVWVASKARFGWCRLDIDDEFHPMELDFLMGSENVGNIWEDPELLPNATTT